MLYYIMMKYYKSCCWKVDWWDATSSYEKMWNYAGIFSFPCIYLNLEIVLILREFDTK